uniref:Uncharacterized protein n=1 Tax=Helianthus annuus TaxID=4232 RepID=A0A251UN25_HELAN
MHFGSICYGNIPVIIRLKTDMIIITSFKKMNDWIKLHTSCSAGFNWVASSYFLQASSSNASLVCELALELTLSADSCRYNINRVLTTI